MRSDFSLKTIAIKTSRDLTQSSYDLSRNLSSTGIHRLPEVFLSLAENHFLCLISFTSSRLERGDDDVKLTRVS